MWKLESLISHCSDTKKAINNNWVPARPINYRYRTIGEKIKESYKVFTGEYDCFEWTEKQ